MAEDTGLQESSTQEAGTVQHAPSSTSNTSLKQSTPSEEVIRLICNEDELKSAWMLRNKCFPEDEAVSLEKYEECYRAAPHLWFGYFDGEKLRGFLRGGGQKDDHYTSVGSPHDPDGETMCLHVLCVEEQYRRRGIGQKLMKAFIDYVEAKEANIKQIILICHAELIPVYTRVGFTLVGRAEVKFGKRSWYECCLNLTTYGSMTTDNASESASVPITTGNANGLKSVPMTTGSTNVSKSVSMTAGNTNGSKSVPMTTGNTNGSKSVPMTTSNTNGSKSVSMTTDISNGSTLSIESEEELELKDLDYSD